MKKSTKRPAGGVKRRKVAGERSTSFFTKGGVKLRVRLFPSPDGYRVSVTKRENDETTDRSVQEFGDVAQAQFHVEELATKAVKAGWERTFGVRGNNAALFE